MTFYAKIDNKFLLYPNNGAVWLKSNTGDMVGQVHLDNDNSIEQCFVEKKQDFSNIAINIYYSSIILLEFNWSNNVHLFGKVKHLKSMDEVYPNITVDARPKGTFLKRNNRGNIGPNLTAVIHIVHIRIHTGRPHNPGRNVDPPFCSSYSSSPHTHFIFPWQGGGHVDGSPFSIHDIEVTTLGVFSVHFVVVRH